MQNSENLKKSTKQSNSFIDSSQEEILRLQSEGLASHPRNHFLDHLLPYDMSKKNKAELLSGLKEYYMLLSASLEASNALKINDLEKFDSLVGENACEIRAVWTAIIAANHLDKFSEIEVLMTQAQTKIAEFLSPKTIASLMQSEISLKELLEKEGLLIELTLEEMFIIQSFLLSEAKVHSPPLQLIPNLCVRRRCDPKGLKKFGDVSSNFTEHLVRKIRKLISAASVHFVRERAFNFEDKHLIHMASDMFTFHHNTCWPCTPMFWTYKVIIKTAQEAGIPLIIHAKFLDHAHEGYKVVDEEFLFFENSLDSENNFHLVGKDLGEKDLKKAAWVIQGVVCPNKQGRLLSKSEWKAAFKRHLVSHVILAGAADHRQYPDPNQDARIIALEDPEYQHFKTLAEKEGFSLENPTTFFIQHVYAAQGYNISSLMEKVDAEKTLNLSKFSHI